MNPKRTRPTITARERTTALFTIILGNDAVEVYIVFFGSADQWLIAMRTSAGFHDSIWKNGRMLRI